MDKKVCVLSFSNIAHDGRVLRQIEFLSREYQVLVISYGNPPSIMADNSNIFWISLVWRSKLMGTINRLFERFLVIPFFPKKHPVYRMLLNCGCNAIHANNWDALPMAAIAAREKNMKLVLDLHESYNSWYWGLNVPIIKYIFRKYANNVNASTTVVQALVEQHRKFGLNPIVIMNAPSLSSNLASHNEINPSKISMIHHGVGSHARRSDLMVRSIALSDKRYELHLVLSNYDSKYVSDLRNLAEKIAPGRVFFYPPYPANKIVDEISKFDLGYFLLPPTNYYYQVSLPNKFFEFLVAGLAVCIGPSPNMAEIVTKYKCGVVAPSFNPVDLSQALNQTTAKQWDEMRKCSREAAKVLNAENEMTKVMKIYKQIFEPAEQ